MKRDKQTIPKKDKKSIPIDETKELLKETRDFINALDEGASSTELGIIRDRVKDSFQGSGDYQAPIYQINSNNSDYQQKAI